MGKIPHYPKQPLSGPPVLYFIRSVYIKERDLSEYFGIPSEEAKEWITENANLSETLYINKENWIDINNINSFFLAKYHFPSKHTLISAYMDETGFVEERYRRLTDIYFRMQKELRANKFIIEVAKEVNLELPRLHSISLSAAIFSYVRDVPTLTNLERFFIYYKYCKDLTNSRKPLFFTNSFDVFRNKYRKFCEHGTKSFIHANFYNNNACKAFSTEEEEFILASFANGAKFRFRQITRDVNTERVRLGLETVSVNKIITFIRNHPEYGTRCLQREGTEGIENRMLHPQRLGTSEPGNVYQIDGTRFNIPCLTDKNEVKLMVLVAIIDVFSRKIVACCLSNTESLDSYEKIIINSVKTNGFLPREIVMDNLPSLNSERAVHFFRKLELAGVEVRHHTKMVPQDKGQIENFFKIFPELYLKKIPGYLGDGIQSRDRDGKPNRDLLIQARKKTNLRSLIQLEKLLVDQILLYNTTYRYKDSTPDELFRNTYPKHTITVAGNLIPMITYKEKSWKVKKTGFQFSHQGTTYQYPVFLEQKDFFLKYLDRQLLVRYSDDNKDEVFVYENEYAGDYLFILKLHEPLPLAFVDRSEEDKLKWHIYNTKTGRMRKELTKVSQSGVMKIEGIENLIPGYDSKDLTKELEDSFILEEYTPVIQITKNSNMNIKGSAKII